VPVETADRAEALGPYRLQGLLGRGGMGEVHRAFDTRRGRVVALKILQSDLARDGAYRARFRRESDTAARLQNPHVIPIHDFGEIDGRLYIDMRLVDGAGLDRLIAAGPMDPRRAVALVAQVAEALGDAHRNGILHRDIKPSNILVTPADFVYLVDFGIARALGDDATALTSAGVAVGTLAYMAPERFGDGVPDARSDVYSLTCTLAECLTGRRPFPATDLPGLMHAHLVADPPRPSLERRAVPQALDDVIARGMAKDPAARFTSPVELAAAAQRALELWGHTVPVAGHPVVAPPRRTRTAVLVAGAAAIAIASGAAGFAVGRSGAGDGGERSAAAVPLSAPAAATSGPPAPVPEPSPAAQPPPAVPGLPPGIVVSPGATGERPASYGYAVESNHPVTLIYTGEGGDQITDLGEDPPWSITVPTDGWGADALPMLVVSSSSGAGDTAVTCTITGPDGAVLASETKEAAYATATCAIYDYG